MAIMEGEEQEWVLESTGGPLMCILQTAERIFYLVMSTEKPWEGFKEATWRRDYSGARWKPA